MRRDDIFPSKYLRAEDLESKAHLYTITKDEMAELRNERGVERKLVLSFKETEKGLVCNPTNFDVMAEFLGPDTESWIGKQVVLYPDRVTFGNKKVDAIRVRAPKKQPSGNQKHVITNRGDYDLSEFKDEPGTPLEDTF